MSTRWLFLALILLFVVAPKTWDFEKDKSGKNAKGFTSTKGTWEVLKNYDNLVLAQKAKNDDDSFNLALVKETKYRNLDLTVRIKAIAGDNDRGGGLVWRAKDEMNYYIARYNPLESNYRVYKVENGKRTMFKNAAAPNDDKWHTLRVTMNETKITCYLDDAKLLEAVDATFAEAGMIGLWSKADAQSYFDDLTVEAK